jgi:hypothetical protein
LSRRQRRPEGDIAASPLLSAAQQQLLNGVPGSASQPGIIAINSAVCAAGGQINVTDLQTLNDTAFPALIGLVGALPMLPNQPAILLGLTLAQPSHADRYRKGVLSVAQPQGSRHCARDRSSCLIPAASLDAAAPLSSLLKAARQSISTSVPQNFAEKIWVEFEGMQHP